MRVLNIGSLNIDFVYAVDHIILPGETEATASRNTFLGGKGMNQSCALAKAGVEVYHGGMIGEDGRMFLDACKEYGVMEEVLRISAKASSIAVTRPGAVPSIPFRAEVMEALND